MKFALRILFIHLVHTECRHDFTHWSFGKQFHKMKLQYDFGLSQIYELVINSDPCYAFLLDTNTLNPK